MSLSARTLLRRGRREGVLCIPDGGVLTTGSGCSGVGGSSGSGSGSSSGSGIVGSTAGSPGFGDRRNPRRAKGFRISSSSSGPGGGSGRGLGMPVGRADAAGLLAGDRKKLSSPPGASSPLPFCDAPGSVVCCSRLPPLSTAPENPPRLVGRELARAVFWSERDALGGLVLRRKISGLCLSRLALVGEAKEGLFFAAVARSGGGEPEAGFD